MLLAEGASSESLVEDDDRPIFHNAHQHPARYPAAILTDAFYCALRLDQDHALRAFRLRRDAGRPRRVGAAPPGVHGIDPKVSFRTTASIIRASEWLPQRRRWPDSLKRLTAIYWR